MKSPPLASFLGNFFRLGFVLDEDVAGLHFFFRLNGLDLIVVELLGVFVFDGGLDGFFEVEVAQCAAAPVLHALVEVGAGGEFGAFGGVREDLVLDHVLKQDAAAGGGGELGQFRAELGFGHLEVSLGDGLAVDGGERGALRVGRGGQSRGGEAQAEENGERQSARQACGAFDWGGRIKAHGTSEVGKC